MFSTISFCLKLILLGENFCSLSHACHKTKKHFIPASRAIFSIDLIVFLQLCRGFYHLYSKWHVIFGRA